MDPVDPPAWFGAPLIPVVGLLLAAGEGSRMGIPKALLRDSNGVAYLERTIGRLLDGGCEHVTVVLGAGAEEAVELLALHGWTESDDLAYVVNPDWRAGMGGSLRLGLEQLPAATCAVVMLVDLPDVDERVVSRLIARSGSDVLARATYAGKPGHPVLLGRSHWSRVAAQVCGDSGARAYLEANDVVEIPCDDLATGRDLDRREDLGLGPRLET